jgi:hypothetical protein
VRGESIWMERESARVVMLTDNGGRRWCSGGNQRGGGVSGGRSRLGRHVGGGEGGELELRCGRGTEQSEAPATSPYQRARGENKRGKWGGGSARCCVEEGKWERERAPDAVVGSADHGVRMAPGGTVRCGTRARGGGRLVNRGGRRGVLDVVRRG